MKTKIKAKNGITLSHPDNSKLLSMLGQKKILTVDNSAPSSMISSPNINVPAGVLQYIRPESIDVLLAPRTADRIATPSQNGKYGDQAIVLKIKELLGTTSIDDGSAGDGLNSSVNYSMTTRGIYYYRADWRVNDIDEARVGAMNENYRVDQANSALEALAIKRNQVFFTGIEEKTGDMSVYGLLNDPSLSPYLTLKNGASGKSYWTDKTPEEIYNDIVDAISELNDKTKGLVNEGLGSGSKLILATTATAISQLNRANSFGLSAIKLLTDTYGGTLEIVAVPQMQNADSKSDVFYLIYTGRVPTVINSYVEMARAYPIFTHASETSQKIASAISGCIVQYPMFIVRYNSVINRK